MQSESDSMRFDWYQATVREPIVTVQRTIEKLGHKLVGDSRLARAHRFDCCYRVEHDDLGDVAAMFWNKQGDNVYPHVKATSDRSGALVDLVRSEWPNNHLVTRMDVAQDFVDPHAYNRIRKVARKVAKAHRVSFPSYSDDLHPEAGRTQYMGSFKAEYLARLYDKGFEQLSKQNQGQTTPTAPMGASGQVLNTLTGEYVNAADWVRLELQMRPKGEEARGRAAQVSPSEAWAFCPWTMALAKEALALDLERITIENHKNSRDEISLYWMTQHYGKMLLRYADKLGSFEAVGALIRAKIDESSKQRPATTKAAMLFDREEAWDKKNPLPF